MYGALMRPREEHIYLYVKNCFNLQKKNFNPQKFFQSTKKKFQPTKFFFNLLKTFVATYSKICCNLVDDAIFRNGNRHLKK